MSRISKAYPAATRQSGSFQVNSASSGIKSSLGAGYAFREQTPSTPTGDEQHMPVYSLPAKLPPTVPMPRYHDVINGVAVIQWPPPSASSSGDVDYSLASPTPPPVYTSSTSSGLSSSSSSPRMAAVSSREGTTGVAVSMNKAMTDDAQIHNGFTAVSSLPHYSYGTMGSADTDTHGRVNGYNGSSSGKQTSHYSGKAEDDTSEYYSENSYSEEQDQRSYYRSQHYGTAPADLDFLMEAAKWKRDDDVDPRIKSGRGTVRGVTNMVRASIEAFTSPDFFAAKKRAAPDERGRVVVYTTSVSAIRRRHESCARALHILHTHGVAFEARDIFISREHMDELRQRLQVPDTQPDVDVPQIFVSGIYLGGIEELEGFNESGDLKLMFAPLEKVTERPMCELCFGHRYIICNDCSGSRKSKSFYRTSSVFAVLRCAQCDENGMVPCELCNPNFRPSARKSSIDLAAASASVTPVPPAK